MNTATLLALTSVGVSGLSWMYYLSRIPRDRVVARPIGSMWIQFVAALFAVGSTAVAGRMGTFNLALFAASTAGVAMSGLFLWLYTQRKTPIGALRVTVGQSLPRFDSLDSEGHVFHSDDLRGHRVLFKFFRGGW